MLQTYKERATISEICETVDPGLITQILLPLLEVNGMRVSLQSSEKAYEMMFAGLRVPRSHGDVVLFDLCSAALQRYVSTLLDGSAKKLLRLLFEESLPNAPANLVQWLLYLFSSSNFSILA